MPLPDLSLFCVKLAPGDKLCVQLPGGATLCASIPSAGIPSADELSKALLAQINTALAPLMPVFDILEVLVAMVNCIKSVEKCLGPPPDPSDLVACFPNLAAAMAKVLKLLPQLSIPVLIGGVLDVLIANLTGIRSRILSYLTKQLRILTAQTVAQAIQSHQLHAAIDCATDDLNVAMANLNAETGALGELLLLVNILLELAGLSPLPFDASSLNTDAKSAIAPLDAILATLTQVRRGFP